MGLGISRRAQGFTVLELLVAMTVLALILTLILPLVSGVRRIADSNAPTFQEARTAFEAMNRMLSQAVLNTYWDYDDPRHPQRYIRASELHFLLGSDADLTALPRTSPSGSAVFFQAPLGKNTGASPAAPRLEGLLNSVGFYTTFSEAEHLPPYLPGQKTDAWRLWMFLQPSVDFSVYDAYNASPQAASQASWFQNGLKNPALNHILANNVILLLLRASYSDTAGAPLVRYVYDSRPGPPAPGLAQPVEAHQIPPLLHATLVVIDQKTADRLLVATGGVPYNLIPANLFARGGARDDASDYSLDMESLRTHLDGRPLFGIPINYRIFEATIPMNASQWSSY